MSLIKRLPRVAIAGRPNVGKSTLFNRLLGRKDAIVDATPGVTRDTKLVKAELNGMEFELVDTAGLEYGQSNLADRLNKLTVDAVNQSDVVLFMLDGKDGITPMDHEIAMVLRASDKPIIVAINKSDVKTSDAVLYETYELGFEATLALSAEHGSGLYDLADALKPYLTKEYSDEVEEEEEGVQQPIPIAIVGRPNAGKSTLVNQLLKAERMLTGPEAGLTRDSIGTLWEKDGQLYELVDTPGIRKQGKVTEELEKMSVTTAMGAIARAEAVVLLMDATHPYEKQDAIIASHAVEKGKPLIIALNKWDIAEDKENILADMKHKLEHSFSQVKGVPMVTFSAMTGKGVDKILPHVHDLHKKWQRKISTAHLNSFLEGMTVTNPHPMRSNRRIKLKYMTQISNEPPTFALFCNIAEEVDKSYLRYLTNGMREAFDLYGIPLEIIPRSTKNPYEHLKDKRG